MKLNQFHSINGYFYTGEYFEWDEDNEIHKDPIKIRFKQNDEGTQGVSSGAKQMIMVQETQGRYTYKEAFTIKVTDNLPYKPQDNFKSLVDNKTYEIKSVIEDYQTTSSINSLQFNKIRDNKIFVLILGER